MRTEDSRENTSHEQRFMEATIRVCDVFETWSRQHMALTQAAQYFDFISSQPEMGEAIRQEAAELLVTAINDSESPGEIVGIYRELYSDVIEEVTQMRADEEGTQD